MCTGTLCREKLSWDRRLGRVTEDLQECCDDAVCDRGVAFVCTIACVKVIDNLTTCDVAHKLVAARDVARTTVSKTGRDSFFHILFSVAILFFLDYINKTIRG